MTPVEPGAAPNDSTLLQAILPLCNRLSDTRLILLAAVAIALGLLARGRMYSVGFLLGSLAAIGFARALKQAFDRPAPFPVPGDPSFPSGHATASMALAAAAIALLPPHRLRWAAVAIAGAGVAGVAVSVVADGGHWPSDVLAGWALALAWVSALALLVRPRTRDGRRAVPARWAVQEIVSGAIRWSGLGFLVRHTIARRRASILLYHDPAPEVLERHLRYLSGRYAFVSLGDLVDALREGRWSSLPANPLVLTFDDAHRGNAALSGLLERYGVVPTIYACSEIVATRRHYWFLEVDNPEALKPLSNAERIARLEREHGFAPGREYADAPQALSAEDVAAMLGAVEFGSHTRFHPVLPTCEDDECEDEIVRSKTELEALTKMPCRHFSFPNGDYGARELEYVRRAGYDSARTTDLGWNDAGTDAYRLRILGTSDIASVNRLAADLSGVAGYIARARQGSYNGRHRPVVRA